MTTTLTNVTALGVEAAFPVMASVHLSQRNAAAIRNIAIHSEPAIPLQPNTVACSGDNVLMCLSPGEWLLRGSSAPELASIAQSAFGAVSHLFVSRTGSIAHVALEGAGVWNIIAKGCSLRRGLDLRPSQCFQTRLADIRVILIPRSDSEGVDVYADGALFGHLAKWLTWAQVDLGSCRASITGQSRAPVKMEAM